MEREFILGSKWLYVKFYCGPKIAEDILITKILPFIFSLKKEEIIEEFFFIRYADPDFHIRLRLKMVDPANFSIIIPKVYSYMQPLLQSHLIWNLEYDTYKRELDRYGGVNLIEFIEHIFYIDSLYAILLLKKLRKSETPEQDRWLLSIILLDDIMEAFHYNLEKKKELMNYCSYSFKQEFDFNGHFYKKQLDGKYRLNKKKISDFIYNVDNAQLLYMQLIAERKKRLNILTSNFKDVITHDIISSILHMSMNRFFKSKNRIFELVIYDFMYRMYTSALAQHNNA